MKLLPLEGRARVLGNDINTDYIIASHRKKETIDPLLLRAYLLEDLDPEFARTVRPGDILVAGNNFGCGSAMEVAVTVVIAAGIRAVIARGFSRTYLRNAMNNGLLAVIADTTPVREGDAISLALNVQGQLVLDNHRDALIECDPIAPFMLDLLGSGGLLAYLRQHGGFSDQVQAVPLVNIR